jgi:hypothetical protein
MLILATPDLPVVCVPGRKARSLDDFLRCIRYGGSSLDVKRRDRKEL